MNYYQNNNPGIISNEIFNDRFEDELNISIYCSY